jgi:hypothetical protein
VALAQSQDAFSTAQRLVVRCGLSVQLRAFPKQIAEQSQQYRGKLPDATIAALAEAGKEAFRPDVLQEEIVRALAARMKLEDMEKAITWLETDAGKRVTLAEELAASLDEATLRKYAAQLKKAPLSGRRIKLANDLLAASNVLDSTAGAVEAMALGVALGMDSMQPVEKRVGASRLRTQIKAAMPPEKIKQALSQSLPGMFAYTYRKVREDDLAAYIVFLTSPGGKRYSDAVMEALNEALVRASVRMGQLMDLSGTKSPV